MKDFFDVIKERRSVRAFKKQEVPAELIETILKSAQIAPCGGNQKNWEFIVVKDEKVKTQLKDIVLKKIDEIAGKMSSPRAKKEFTGYSKYFTFFSDAPVVIAVVMKPYDSLTGRILKRYYKDSNYQSFAGLQSVSAAIENLLLSATALGLGSCWMTGPLLAKDELEKILNIESPSELVAIIPIGFPQNKLKPNEFPDSIKDFVRFM